MAAGWAAGRAVDPNCTAATRHCRLNLPGGCTLLCLCPWLWLNTGGLTPLLSWQRRGCRADVSSRRLTSILKEYLAALGYILLQVKARRVEKCFCFTTRQSAPAFEALNEVKAASFRSSACASSCTFENLVMSLEDISETAADRSRGQSSKSPDAQTSSMAA